MNTNGYTGGVTRQLKEPPTPLAAWVRKVRGPLSQETFAEKVGVHWVTVNRWESQGAGMRQRSVQRILKAFPDVGHPPIDGLSDPDRKVDASTKEHHEGAYAVTTYEGQTVGRELDEIDDPTLRKRARTAALAAIDAERAKSNPLPLGADNRSDRAQRK